MAGTPMFVVKAYLPVNESFGEYLPWLSCGVPGLRSLRSLVCILVEQKQDACVEWVSQAGRSTKKKNLKNHWAGSWGGPDLGLGSLLSVLPLCRFHS